MSGLPEGIDPARVEEWFVAHVPGASPHLSFELISGGRSNLTYRVTDGGGRSWALRRPPTGHVLPTAHDMGREFRIISALWPTPVPVAEPVAFCSDPSVTGAAFYVMGFVEGVVVRTQEVARAALDAGARRRAGLALVEVLAALHALGPDEVGLGDLGPKEAYIARQLRRWRRQWEASKTRDLPEIDEVHRRLESRIPPQGPARIVHGDYRLDNCILGPDGELRAVVDWELCTLGDPLADVGLLMVYWSEPGEGGVLGAEAGPTAVEGFPTREEVKRRYAELSGRDLDGLDFYVAFGYWKLACIVEGVYARYRAGAMGGDRTDVAALADRTLTLAAAALEASDRLR